LGTAARLKSLMKCASTPNLAHDFLICHFRQPYIQNLLMQKFNRLD
jgi:hypothetical protein